MKPRMNSLYNGLIEFWPLHEPSGNRFGLVKNTELTDVNTCTQEEGRVFYAARFTSANSERMGIVTNSDVECGDIDFTWAAWVYFTTVAATQTFISKYGSTTASREYAMYFDQSVNRLKFSVYTSGGTERAAVANTLGGISAATWYFCVGWHDAAADTVGIEVNGLTDTAATTAALQAVGSAALNFGSTGAPGVFTNGRLCEVGFWKRVLTPLERLWLYNQGLGRTYPFDGRPGFKPRKPWQEMMGPLS